MLDLDKYINNYKEVSIFGDTIHVLEPNMRMIEEIDALESDMTKENVNTKRIETAVILLNHNKENKEYTKEQLIILPHEAVITLIALISSMRLEAEQDPNSESPSQVGK